MKPKKCGFGNGYSVVKISILISCILYGSCVYVKDVEEDLDFDTLLQKEMVLPKDTSRRRRYGDSSYTMNLMSYIEEEGFIPNAEKELIRSKRQTQDDVVASGGGGLEDINECDDPNICNSKDNSVCENNNGSYECVCKKGFDKDGSLCKDIDECKTSNGQCDHNCQNTNGSFYCDCQTGYELNVNNKTCDDINECDTNKGGCDHNCTNTGGSFTCVCDDGYKLNIDNITCGDINECDDPNICNSKDNSECQNNIGSYECVCKKGFEKDGSLCKDINECDDNNGGCKATCTNSVGSYECSCPAGFKLEDDGKNCKDTSNQRAFFSAERSAPTRLLGDDNTALVRNEVGISYDSSQVNNIYIGTNGIISFGVPYNSYSPSSSVRNRDFIAPYWVDMNPDKGGSIEYQVLDSNNDPSAKTTLVEMSNDINTLMNRTGFGCTWAMIVNYNDLRGFLSTDDTQTVKFQVVVVSDGTETYAIYLYKYNEMLWQKQSSNIVIGFTENKKFSKNVYSETSAAYTIDQYVGNTGQNGYWIFKIGAFVALNPAQSCFNWYLKQDDNPSLLNNLRSLPNCPCRYMSFDRRWRISSITRFSFCTTLVFGFRGHSKECCYNRRFRSLIFSIPQRGSSWQYNPWFFPALHYEHDFLPKQWCCSSSRQLCNLYYAKRPNRFCSFRFRFRRAWFFGDPHILTLDGKSYVFNGHGEYILFNLKSGNDTMMIQGRTAKAETSNGTLSDATIFTAFAIEDSNGANFQVELNSNKSGLIIYGINFIDLTTQFYNDENYTYSDSDMKLTITRNGSSISAVFAQGITMDVDVGVKLLTFSLSVPTLYENSTTGLLGNFNGISDDDFVTRNGTILSSSLSEREIFHYGQEWQILSSESIFKYPPRKGVDDFAFPAFVPLFLDEQPQSIRDEAARICGGNDKLACIYDYVATGSAEVAKATRSSNDESVAVDRDIENTSPEINGTEVINATINEPVSMTVQGFDEEDGSNVVYNIVSKPDNGFSFNNVTGNAIWTPGNTDPINIAFSVADSRGVESPQLDVEVRLCDGCSGHGDCDHSTLLQRSSEQVSTFQLVACKCHLGWSGDSCSEDFDACSTDPCLEGQNCTDLPADLHNDINNGYNCTACPQGLKEDGIKCKDIDECNTTNACDQICSNTRGSYTCSCKSGFRKSGFGKCTDINECDELVSDCEHICENTVGSYNCSCRPGYNLKNDNKTCQIDDATLCKNSGCQDGCEVKGSVSSCFCNSGYKLKADKKNCTDEDECTRDPNPCSQICNNTVGSFSCFCYPGFTLADDKITCEECAYGSYGANCESTCGCSEHATTCDKVRGCICKTGWRGSKCYTDVDECAENTFSCPENTFCSNTRGSYQCRCQDGYERKDGLCVDINECANLMLQNCGDNTLCENTNGSFVCKCKSGYVRDTPTKCKDFDECATNTHDCLQKCVNFDGTYNCECEYGFELDGDRKNCLKVENVCADFENLNCSYACNVSLSGESANCYCQNGFKLLSDQQTCQDINECEDNTLNDCSDNCVNKLGSYSCSCPVGKALENDGRKCSDCDDSHWGSNCLKDCSCGIGASKCDKVKGCICKDGWQGDKCDQDKDECAAVNVCPQLSTCRNIPGNFVCDCRQGYTMAPNKTCIDIDECASNDLNDCDSVCTNTIGSYECSCHDGFILKSGKCEDIDECASEKDNCAHTCRNEIGSYACECRNGYKISETLANECTRNNDANCSRTDCSQECVITDSSAELCFCRRGYELDDDDISCKDINECDPNPCEDVCTEGDIGTYSCNCTKPGYELDADELSCRECSEGFYGVGCTKECTCIAANTISCNKTDGGCNCRNGWKGDMCETDIDECTDGLLTCSSNSQCRNVDGSAICVCNIGFFKSEDLCVACDNTHWGEQCTNSCTCNINNVLTCNKINGSCTCKETWKGINCETDVNECVNNASICGTAENKCFNLNGTYRCDCSDGYQKNQEDKCIDIDECRDEPCPKFEQCTNTVGTYSCACPSVGFKTESGICTDINECDTNKGGCEHNCTNTDGSFTCVCDVGYKLNIDKTTCADINECDDPNICNSKDNSECENNIGSYECVCKKGFEKDGSLCKDVNECDVNNGGCNATCTNNVGSYQCSCPVGFKLEDDGKNCKDLGACGINNGECEQTCVNKDGDNRVICGCFDGFYNDTITTCKDIDECKTSNGQCDHNCQNTNGSYYCDCQTGFELNANNKTCDDKDECVDLTICDAKDNTECKNTAGSYSCECIQGFDKDGTMCKDINECETNNGGCEDICDNFPGTFACRCKAGYDLRSDNKTCEDQNECLNPNTCKRANEVCKNTIGTFLCNCDEGYVKDGINCIDVDECAKNEDECEQNCTNTDGSFQCFCNEDFALNDDNKTCSDRAVISMSITLDDPINITTVFENRNSKKYKDFEESIELALFNLFKKTIKELLRIVIKGLRKGSIIAEYDLVLRLTSGDNVDSSLGIAETAKKLLDGESLIIGNTTYELRNLTINNQTVRDLKLCELFEAANGKCASGKECGTDDGKPVCKSLSNDVGLDVIIGLSVGIPLAFLLIALITCIVCFKLTARNKKRDALVNGNGNGFGSVNNFAFSSSLPKRSSHGAGMYLPYIPDGLSAASSSDSGTQTRKTKKRKGRDDFRDSAWYDSQSAPEETQPHSNFSWDYLYRMLQPESKFEIKRPKVNGSPRSGFTNVNRQSAA